MALAEVRLNIPTLVVLPHDPLEAEYSLPDRLKTRTVEEELLARAHEQAEASGESVPPRGMAYDAGRLGPRRR